MEDSRSHRQQLIQSIEKERDSRLVVYITSDRQGLETRISADVFPIINKHLSDMQEQDRLDLFLYSPGGLIIAGYAIVNLLKEYCREFSVVVPFKALSTATLIALGGKEIVMTKMGQLSPIDPSVAHPLGPTVQMPRQPTKQIAPVSVEDVNAFVDLAKDEIGLRGQGSMRRVFETLASEIHPLVLGAVQRSRQQIAFLGSKLMKYHTKDENRVKETIKILTRERFSHEYIIGRREAKEVLGLNVVQPSSELTQQIIGLFNAYNEILKMDKPYNPEVVLGAETQKVADFNRGIVETTGLTSVYRTTKEIERRVTTDPGSPPSQITYMERILREEWMEDNTI